MGRARRARRIASSAAYGGGGLAALAGALGAAGYGLIRAEAAVARRLIGRPFDDSPDDNGLYGHGPGEPVELLMLGDSTAAGLGTDERSQTIGAILASGVAAPARGGGGGSEVAGGGGGCPGPVGPVAQERG